MKYNAYEAIDANDFEYIQSVFLAESQYEICEAAAYYQALETDDITYWSDNPSHSNDFSESLDNRPLRGHSYPMGVKPT